MTEDEADTLDDALAGLQQARSILGALVASGQELPDREHTRARIVSALREQDAATDKLETVLRDYDNGWQDE